MRLFIDDGYALDDSSPTYKEHVGQLGELALQETTAFLSAQGANAVLKALRKLHREGILNDRIFAYQQRLAIGRIVDPAPSHCQRALKQEADKGQESLQEANQTAGKTKAPGAQTYVNRFLVRIKEIASRKKVNSHLNLPRTHFGVVRLCTLLMILAENWIIERGVGSTTMSTRPSVTCWTVRVLSGWKPKEGAWLPSLHALEESIRVRAPGSRFLTYPRFAETALNIDEDVADILTVTLVMHNPVVLMAIDSSTFASRMREAMAARSTGESEVLVWSGVIRRSVVPSTTSVETSTDVNQSTPVLELLKNQSEQIDILILQSKILNKRLLDMEKSRRSSIIGTCLQNRHIATADHPTALRPNKKNSQSILAVWYEWFRAGICVYFSRTVKKTTLFGFQHMTDYIIIFVLTRFAFDNASTAFKSDVHRFGEIGQENTIVFLKASGSSAVAAGTALKALRQLHKTGHLDKHVAQFQTLRQRQHC
ncbi:hypothetical protein PHMEG_00018274 [Phytophthora megakarya]|uniref:Uncharacterized protein n=1 Tax=Phytophthora megakarya TaxID=4795 RepID=A0A225VW93_9STRA|nr:hypothetical protein PHMEG_00018274 [Phytophthora megakarya]